MKHSLDPEKFGCDKNEFDEILDAAIDAFNASEGDPSQNVVSAAKAVQKELRLESGEDVRKSELTQFAVGYVMGQLQIRSRAKEILDRIIELRGTSPAEMLIDTFGLAVTELIVNGKTAEEWEAEYNGEDDE